MVLPLKKWHTVLSAMFVITSLTFYIYREWRLALMKRKGMEEDAMELAMSTVVKVGKIPSADNL